MASSINGDRKTKRKKKVIITRFEFLESCPVTKHLSQFDTWTLEFTSG